MADQPTGSFEEYMAASDAEYEVYSKVVEMADRVRVADKVVPGAQAKWTFDMGGVTYRVTIEVEHG